ncbi:hypothetical protein B9Z55_021521 [Caenorhabditis nigoni]|uniref:DOT1 domain-containing protein n=1 Tax=Caenorhabditis nigoni TaxID=1611254 RepID=A0A2G5TSE3_9PELO|nr:hypothetical protein B9Z55_021521 [Caenorhabditis nigoni]
MNKLKKKILNLCKSGTRIVVTKLIDQTRMTKDNYAERFDSYSETVDLDSIAMEWTDKGIKFWLTAMNHDKEEKREAFIVFQFFNFGFS